MKNLAVVALFVIPVLAFMNHAGATLPGRPAPLMGLPVMTGLDRIAPAQPAWTHLTTQGDTLSPSHRQAATLREEDVVSTARKTLSVNEEVVTPQ